QNQKGEDVTEEFVDLEARIATTKKLEERILELLDTRDGEIKDVIDIERELARVRTDIERMEGRLRFLDDRTSLTTVTIEAREQQDYAPAEAPGLGGRIAGAWTSSTSSLLGAVEGVLLFGIACVPWLVAVGIVAGPVLYWTRRG